MAGETPTHEPILVLGATGRQGGAVARHLLRSGFRVRAMTRDPEKPAARALAGLNIDVVRGDMDDRASLEAAMRSAYGVFSVQDFWQAGVEGEVRQGMLVADVARSLGVQQFVYTSVASADRNTGLPHFESKWIIEQHIHEIGLPFTILRPVFFMDNWEYVREQIANGILPQPLSPDRRLQQIATDDIGAIAALAFCNPGRWLGSIVELAGDEPTMLLTAEAFGNAVGHPVRYVQVSWEDFARGGCEELTAMYRWFEDVGYEVDIPTVRTEYPKLMKFNDFLQETGWAAATATGAMA